MDGVEQILVFGSRLLALAKSLASAEPEKKRPETCLIQASLEVSEIVDTLGEHHTIVEYRALLAAIAGRIIQELAQAEELVDG